MLNSIDSEKPILTTYAPAFDPIARWRVKVPYKMVFDKYIQNTIAVKPAFIDDFRRLHRPLPARFLSGHFFFTIGNFCREVEYDPQLYFLGEEITMAVRAFTHGYDLFHPHKTILWHEYTREDRRKHWEDHDQKADEGNESFKTWWERDAISFERVKGLFEMNSEIALGKYGFGKTRTLRDYEKYAGINFGLKSAQQYTIKGHDPPNPNHFQNESEWLDSFTKEHHLTIRLPANSVSTNNISFWYVGIHDENEEEIHRRDLNSNEVEKLLGYETINFDINFFSSRVPASWTIWPYSTSNKWLHKVTKKIGDR